MREKFKSSAFTNIPQEGDAFTCLQINRKKRQTCAFQKNVLPDFHCCYYLLFTVFLYLLLLIFVVERSEIFKNDNSEIK